MFTGLIEEQGRIRHIATSDRGMVLTVECKNILKDIKIGSSICIDGACQSVTNFGKDYICVFASNETLAVTTFKKLKCNQFVNLERAITLNKRLDGHIVSGHVDCMAEFVSSQNDGDSKRFFFKLPDEYVKYVIYKGSIAINGVSLTVASIDDNIFSVELIPVTLKEVNFKHLKIGDFVNIETDLFAKYVEKIVKSKYTSKLDYDFLKENGYT